MTASYKRLIPCILIAGGKAVTWFDDKTLIAEDVIGLAKYYSDHGADELIVFDLSDSDEEQHYISEDIADHPYKNPDFRHIPGGDQPCGMCQRIRRGAYREQHGK